ncbi:hypothetical protein BJY01DRAFT_254768 [Aspergillus pseudoustus]|uniref:Uncharacterized protein n=1 Tax=Aspergillus pseudoustus TaxID=1810923 RepID=A0ABR4IQS8_9EURO
MDHYLLPLFSRIRPRQTNATSNDSNESNTSNVEITSPNPVYLSGVSHANDTFDPLETTCTNDPPPKYSRNGNDIEMGVLPTYEQAVTSTGASLRRRRDHFKKKFLITLTLVIIFFVMVGCLFGVYYKG